MARPFSRSPRHSLLIATLLGTFFGTAPLAAAQPDKSPESHRIQVQAQAEIKTRPDMATLSARLWEHTPAVAATESTADPDALGKARQRLEERTGKLIRTLEKEGLQDQAITAGSLSVRPDYVHHRARGSDDPEERQVRTRLERPLSLRIDDLERLPGVLDALTRAGVDALDGVSYDLKDRDAVTDRALRQALEKARHKAELMAGTLNVKLGPVLSIQETDAPIFAPRLQAMSADAQRGASPTYRPGEISVDAGVSVTWKIKR